MTEAMNHRREFRLGQYWLLGVWAVAVMVAGAALTSLHQPLRTPSAKILALAPAVSRHEWRAVHFLSGGCGCSQRVMRHLLERRPFAGVAEAVVVVDGPEPYLDGSDTLLRQLGGEGYAVSHIEAKSIPEDAGLRGVPVLVFASPEGKVVYLGGYGRGESGDVDVLRQVSSGLSAKPLAVVGCVIGEHLRQSSDPFHLKYKN